jgi:hypothetical protein
MIKKLRAQFRKLRIKCFITWTTSLSIYVLSKLDRFKVKMKVFSDIKWPSLEKMTKGLFTRPISERDFAVS